NGINGRLFTGPNGNSIFLPATGYRRGSELYSAGFTGHYWSSSLYSGIPNDAWLLSFNFNSDGCMGSLYRGDGRSVRPVCVSQN
ncbi:MAG: hypothetical protein II630_06465, partial [Bacteroidales bacterium]|nr:hypothetical protein [Bacteroidales bacterium]